MDKILENNKKGCVWPKGRLLPIYREKSDVKGDMTL